jgi:tripartite-type tricarboxylate transporter receptor subunit TctC
MPTTRARASAALGLLVILAACGAAGGTAPASKSRPAAPGGGPPVGASDGAAVRGVEDFYRGKTVRVIVGSAAGGGFDTYSRVIARHLGKYLPGNPNLIVENMTGAGSLIAANYVSRAAPKDGTVIGAPQGGLIFQQLLGLEGVEFDALRWQLLGVPASDTNLCVATRASGLRSIAEVMNPGGKGFVIGGAAPGSAIWDVPMRLRSALDLNLRVVEGYDGTAKVRLAMDQNEVEGLCGWSWESLQATGLDRVEAGDWNIIVQVADQPLRDLPTVPMALDFARGDQARQLIRLGIIIPSKILRPYFVAPEVPADRAAALRDAFAATMNDAEFRADAEKAKLDLAPIAGEDAERLIRELFAMPDELKVRLRQINDKES